MGVIDAVMGSDDQHRSVIEKGWREGHEYFRVEPQLICHDGESIQVGGVWGKIWEREYMLIGPVDGVMSFILTTSLRVIINVVNDILENIICSFW